MLTVVSFVFVLGVLIFIHELGHFLVAKKVGIKVEKFSLGFPPNIFSKTVGDTTYCIGLIPLGGYVKMLGENPDEETNGSPDEFMSKTILQRAAVIFAGPFMNYVLAIAILIGITFFTGRPVFDENRIIVGKVTEEGPAFNAGLNEDDIIIGIDGAAVSDYDSLRIRINSKINEQLNLTWVRGIDTINADIVTTTTMIPMPDGSIDTIGIIGFYEKPLDYESVGIVESINRGFITAHIIVYETVKFVGNMVSGKISPDLIGGPVFIAKQSGKEAEKGVSSLLFFMALLSVNLAVLNVLPVPILDGGHLVFLAIEAVRGGNPLSMRAKMWAQQVGMVVLLSLIIFVTYNDILRLFKG